MFNVYEADGGVSCPECSKHWKAGQLAQIHADRDYGSEIKMECPCGKHFLVEVEARPEFSRVPEPRKAARAS